MQTRPVWRSPLFLPLVGFVLAAAAAFALALQRARAPTPDPLPAPAPAGLPTPLEAPAAMPMLAREAGPAPAAPAAAPGERTFAERIDELVAIGQRTAELAQQDDVAAAKASDERARELFGELLARFADAGERALALLTTLPEPAEAPTTNGRRVVLQLVARAECERRHEVATAAADRSRIDAFVQAILDAMPSTAVAAEVGEALLDDQPYLRAIHEAGVLQLVRLAGEDAFPRRTATQLLLTLWDNLQRFGERSSEELARLALILMGDRDPSQRAAACRQLLKDPRYRNLVLAWLREHNDRAVANDVAEVAAREMPVPEALGLLRELSGTLPRAPNAYLLLGFRAPEAVADDYRALLAANTHPDVRCDLITGVGMTRTPLALEIARLALTNDPSPEARLQAVFALTAQAAAEHGETAIVQALDDPRIAGDPTRVGALVLALDNLAASGDVNAVDRVAQRLQRLPMHDDARRGLAAILARCLPGGATTR